MIIYEIFLIEWEKIVRETIDIAVKPEKDISLVFDIKIIIIKIDDPLEGSVGTENVLGEEIKRSAEWIQYYTKKGTTAALQTLQKFFTPKASSDTLIICRKKDILASWNTPSLIGFLTQCIIIGVFLYPFVASVTRKEEIIIQVNSLVKKYELEVTQWLIRKHYSIEKLQGKSFEYSEEMLFFRRKELKNALERGEYAKVFIHKEGILLQKYQLDLGWWASDNWVNARFVSILRQHLQTGEYLKEVPVLLKNYIQEQKEQYLDIEDYRRQIGRVTTSLLTQVRDFFISWGSIFFLFFCIGMFVIISTIIYSIVFNHKK